MRLKPDLVEAATPVEAARAYWRPSLVVGVVAGVFGWWAMGDYVGGITLAVLIWIIAVSFGWQLDPFLPPGSRARDRLEKSRH